MPTVNPGDSVSVSAKAVASKPKWIRWAGQLSLTGTAKLPSGHRRLITLDTADTRAVADYYVAPQSIELTDAPWRATIFAPNGSYITSTGLGDVSTIGTPKVRIGVNAPSKAVIQYPVSKGSQNIVAPTFAGWSDGHIEAVSRGMEVTVEYRDASSGSMRTAFRGMVYQIESGETITLTAYDRLMDLAQFSDQYQSTTYNRYTETLNRASTGSTTYNFVASMSPGVVVACTGWSVYRIDCLNEQSWDYGKGKPGNYIKHPLPTTGEYGPLQGNKIRQLSVKFSTYHTWTRLGSHTVTGYGQAILYRNGIAIAATSIVQFMRKSQSDSTNIQASGTLTIDVDWTLDGPPGEYMVGAYVYTTGAGTGNHSINQEWYDYKSSFSTVSTVYVSSDGGNWSQLSGDHPEIAVNFEIPTSINPTNVSTSGTNVYVQQSAFPTYTANYLSAYDKGVRIYLDYLISGAAGLANIIRDLIEWAGLTPDMVGGTNLGSTTFYTTSTYDYMTCIQEILKGGNYAVKASIEEPGKAYVRSRHTVSETPSQTFTTDPSATGKQIIVAHDLTAHWMAEKATQAYIAENATSSGLPVALETDDALMDNSLVEIMQSPLRSVISDKTLGTHDLQANAAGGKMVQLHTNVFEGKMTLAGYRLDIWDFTSSYCGGMPIGINVPEYGAQGTAIPTEIILGDGVTQISLDNIRTADRSEIANSMGLTADAISNTANTLPEAVYIFARMDTSEVTSGVTTPETITDVSILNSDGTTHTQTSGTYIKVINDNAGYVHIMAVFPATAEPSGYAPVNPIDRVRVTWGGVTRYAVFNNPKPALTGQNVHVDIRIKRA